LVFNCAALALTPPDQAAHIPERAGRLASENRGNPQPYLLSPELLGAPKKDSQWGDDG
jgi:hypothetical protein